MKAVRNLLLLMFLVLIFFNLSYGQSCDCVQNWRGVDHKIMQSDYVPSGTYVNWYLWIWTVSEVPSTEADVWIAYPVDKSLVIEMMDIIQEQCKSIPIINMIQAQRIMPGTMTMICSAVQTGNGGAADAHAAVWW